jgi:uncharacterized protein YkwD
MSDFDLPITALTIKRHRRAVVALVNDERVKQGLKPLRFTGSLSISAHAWALAMVRSSTFGHGNFAKRILRFPFVVNGRPRRREVGENLAFATGTESTPRAIVADWMGSPGHRANILGNWTYGAVWSARDAPLPGKQKDGVTVVQHFGRTVS